MMSSYSVARGISWAFTDLLIVFCVLVPATRVCHMKLVPNQHGTVRKHFEFHSLACLGLLDFFFFFFGPALLKTVPFLKTQEGLVSLFGGCGSISTASGVKYEMT